jgi:hypothetical protein
MRDHGGPFRVKSWTSVAFSLTCTGVMIVSALREADLPLGKQIPPQRRAEASITPTVTPTG